MQRCWAVLLEVRMIPLTYCIIYVPTYNRQLKVELKKPKWVSHPVAEKRAGRGGPTVTDLPHAPTITPIRE